MDAYMALIVPWTGSLGGGGRPDNTLPGGPPTYVGGGPMPGGRPVDPGYGQGHPLPPHAWWGGGGGPVDPGWSGGWGGNYPTTGPIWPGGGGRPDNSLPWAPAHPGNRPPWAPVYPSQGLPGGGGPVDPGYGRPSWSPVDPGYGRPSWSPVDPGYGRPSWGGGRVDNTLPGGGGVVMPPIVIPPSDLPTEPIGDDKMLIVVWVPDYGFKLLVVPKPPGAHTKPIEPSEPKA